MLFSLFNLRPNQPPFVTVLAQQELRPPENFAPIIVAF